MSTRYGFFAESYGDPRDWEIIGETAKTFKVRRPGWGDGRKRRDELLCECSNESEVNAAKKRMNDVRSVYEPKLRRAREEVARIDAEYRGKRLSALREA